MDYKQYRKHLDTLMEAQRTTGANQEEWLVDYTRLNIQRMRKVEENWKPSEQQEDLLLTFETPLRWITLTEGWSGDAAHIVPVIEKIAQINPLMQHQVLLRDENPELMDKFLTDGERAIPKTIFLDAETDQVWGSWGPRPKAAMELIHGLEASRALPKEAIFSQLHAWYQKDRGCRTAWDFIDHLQAAVLRKKADTQEGS
ncbi:thioredoxin family protein [Flavihumibacter petaseus]|uniref:Thioredoxin n=1 Tax=Flavihumibacter petaseus NBRC 106054 TaxID=1220578 RepID=A0A0E9MXE2_9BACT|nr:thioredoxin family protein [Flavihumibacter petaseus]GAO42367.1 hypothetical protein FPE01S_01_13820 [Flavihumibacter petaseus NBRC 106054]